MKNTFVNQSRHGNGETQKTLIKIKYGQKSRRTKDLVLKTDPTITSGGWKQEGLEFVSRNETLGAKQGSSHHIKARITVFSEKNDFSFTESQSTCFITLGFFDIFSSKSEPASNWSRCGSRSVNLTHSRMQNTLFPPTAVGNTTCISHWLGERNPNCHRRAMLVSSQGVLNYKALQRVNKGKGDHCRNTTTWGTGKRSKWAQGADRLIFPSLPPEDGLSLKWKEQLPRSGVIATACDLSPAARYTTPSFCKCIRENTCSDHWWQLS